MLIAFSGKKTCGKDTSGSIAQILLNSPHLNNVGVKDFLRKQVDPDGTYYSKWEIKKFADKLKDMVCLLIGCNRKELENEEFKNTELNPEWTVAKVTYRKPNNEEVSFIYDYNTYGLTKETESVEDLYESKGYELLIRQVIFMTPRLLLQLIGTECGRNILHPNIWVNSTMAEYKSKLSSNHPVDDLDWEPRFVYPNWIITDMRFPNELSAIKDRKGITIRVNRKAALEGIKKGDYIHPSETALDDATFDYVIDNDGTIDELIDTVREILQKEGLLTKN